MSKQRFTIYVNGVKLLFDIPATKRDAQRYIRMFLVSTHMGQWVKIHGGYEYNTTIGKNYTFVREETRHG